jgi:inhibitor of KinA
VDALRIKVASDSSLLIIVGDTASDDVQRRVALLTKGLLRLRDPQIRNVHPAYASVLIDFDPLKATHPEIMAKLTDMEHLDDGGATEQRLVEIPVCYGHEFGLDLEDVSKELGISTEEVTRQHAAGTYRVSFFGFTPGFAYLSGLSHSLHVSRLASPRRLVQAGSVAMAGAQTGVYSVDSPGGWRILGKTPWRMFDPHADPPTPLEIGDQVKFVPITRTEFDQRVAEPDR